MPEHLAAHVEVIKTPEYPYHATEKKVNKDKKNDHAEMLLIGRGNAGCTALDDPRKGESPYRPVDVPDTDEKEGKPVAEEHQERNETAYLEHADNNPYYAGGDLHPRNAGDHNSFGTFCSYCLIATFSSVVLHQLTIRYPVYICQLFS